MIARPRRKGHAKSRLFLCGESRYMCAGSRKRYSEGKRRNVTLGLINAARVFYNCDCRDKSPNAGIQSQTGKRDVCIRAACRKLYQRFKTFGNFNLEDDDWKTFKCIEKV
ncbi:hypothetical protein HZU73_04142 [Apis mellifera caucasica]|uniref:Uncharacterized protein LOC102655858 n=1 Tax=Apis mellifera TaxID=7460 RepID=A0A7M7GXZ6_APIME|nr:uncharacterized protein LOC102655858 [Apis mellifera]KAG6800469.1 hypothetical protein HZU73_04142 [Apis mellifera caucasica]|eukprot:XP_006569517.1 uncharacterized protein LOC102655858 [Apis mellifera]